MYVYVINKNGKPLMPCKPAKAKHLLKSGKAKVIKRIPFTIKLLWDCEENTQEVVAGMDTGSKVIGCAAIANGKADNIYFKKHVAKGDYQQTKGSRSEKKIPTGKLFGLRKFDYIQTPKGIGFVKGKRSTGFFAISDLEGNAISSSVNVKKDCTRLKARNSTLIERRKAHSPTGQAAVVPCA